jgi:hypothetical protein
MGSPESKFTKEAGLIWALIPGEAQARILANVFCVRCCKSVQITKFGGEVVEGDIHLRGFGAKCGHEVVRVVETSEIDHSKN